MLTDHGDIARWFALNRHRMTGRGVWFQGGEPGSQPARAFQDACMRVLFVRLSPYRDVAASLTHGLLMQLAGSVQGVFADVAYWPPKSDRELMLDAGVPPLTGVTTKRPALDFDLVGFSISLVYEMINVAPMLMHSGVPLGSAGRERVRASGGRCPALIAGGANVSALSALMGPPEGVFPPDCVLAGDDSLLDGAFIGEAEQGLPALLRLWMDMAGERQRASTILALQGRSSGTARLPRSRRTRRSKGSRHAISTVCRCALAGPCPLTRRRPARLLSRSLSAVRASAPSAGSRTRPGRTGSEPRRPCFAKRCKRRPPWVSRQRASLRLTRPRTRRSAA
jgi:hypothetical protein